MVEQWRIIYAKHIYKKSNGSFKKQDFCNTNWNITLQLTLHLAYKNCISLTKQAFRIQKLRFVYKYSVVDYKDGFLFFKVASCFTINLYN